MLSKRERAKDMNNNDGKKALVIRAVIYFRMHIFVPYTDSMCMKCQDFVAAMLILVNSLVAERTFEYMNVYIHYMINTVECEQFPFEPFVLTISSSFCLLVGLRLEMAGHSLFAFLFVCLVCCDSLSSLSHISNAFVQADNEAGVCVCVCCSFLTHK